MGRQEQKSREASGRFFGGGGVERVIGSFSAARVPTPKI